MGRKNLFNAPQTVTPSTPNPAGMVTPPNTDLGMQPIIHNEDGSISGVRSASFNDGPGREVLIPTVAHDGSRLLSMPEAIQQYRQTGKHLGVFATPEHADTYAEQLHNDYMNGKVLGYPKPSPLPAPKNVQGGNSLDYYRY